MSETSEEKAKAFRTALVDVGKTLSVRDVKALAFECGIQRADADRLSEGWELFDHMLKKTFIHIGNVDPLIKLLEHRDLKEGSGIMDKYKDIYIKGAVHTEGIGSPLNAQSDDMDVIIDDDDDILMELSTKLREEWNNLGRKLKITDADLYTIKADYSQNRKEAMYQMLLSWKQKNGDSATYRVLADAMLYVKRQDLYDYIRKRCRPT